MIEILLATYNSEKYLREQIDSIIEQDCDNWKLIIRDGGSNDSTIEIINDYYLRFPEQVKVIQSIGRSSAVENFSALLEASNAEYIMFADHDDIWFKNKVSCSFDKIVESEKKYGCNSPLMVFSDMQVVDADLNILSDSFFDFQKLNPSKLNLRNMLVQNIPSGCTMIINRNLAEIASPVPVNAVMHDHWLAIAAVVFGHIVFLEKPTLMYRQHSNNVFGASQYGLKYLCEKIFNGRKLLRKRFFKDVEQAVVFLQNYHEQLSPEYIELLGDFTKLKDVSGFRAWKILLTHKILKNGFMRNLGMFYILL